MPKQSLFLLCFSFSLSVNAALIDLGSSTLDDVSGVEWLDMSFTLGMSYNEMISEISMGGALQGWGFATEQQITELYNNVLALYPGDYDFFRPVSQIQQALGVTEVTEPDSSFSVVRLTNGYYYTPDINPGLAKASFMTYRKLPIGRLDILSIPNSFDPNIGNSKIGAFLVAGGKIPEVPVPAAAWLFGSALVGLVGLRYRNKCQLCLAHKTG